MHYTDELIVEAGQNSNTTKLFMSYCHKRGPLTAVSIVPSSCFDALDNIYHPLLAPYCLSRRPTWPFQYV